MTGAASSKSSEDAPTSNSRLTKERDEPLPESFAEDQPARVQRIEAKLTDGAFVVTRQIQHAHAHQFAIQKLAQRQDAATPFAHCDDDFVHLVAANCIDEIDAVGENALADDLVRRFALFRRVEAKEADSLTQLRDRMLDGGGLGADSEYQRPTCKQR